MARLGVEREGGRLADLGRLELGVEHPEDAVRGYEAGEAARFLEGLRALKQAACGAIEGGSEQGQYLPGERREIGEAGLGLRYSGAAEKEHLTSIACGEQLVRERWTVGDEPHSYVSLPARAGELALRRAPPFGV